MHYYPIHLPTSRSSLAPLSKIHCLLFFNCCYTHLHTNTLYTNILMYRYKCILCLNTKHNLLSSYNIPLWTAHLVLASWYGNIFPGEECFSCSLHSPDAHCPQFSYPQGSSPENFPPYRLAYPLVLSFFQVMFDHHVHELHGRSLSDISRRHNPTVNILFFWLLQSFCPPFPKWSMSQRCKNCVADVSLAGSFIDVIYVQS